MYWPVASLPTEDPCGRSVVTRPALMSASRPWSPKTNNVIGFGLGAPSSPCANVTSRMFGRRSIASPEGATWKPCDPVPVLWGVPGCPLCNTKQEGSCIPMQIPKADVPSKSAQALWGVVRRGLGSSTCLMTRGPPRCCTCRARLKCCTEDHLGRPWPILGGWHAAKVTWSRSSP